MSTDFSNVKSGVVFTKSQQKQGLQSGDTIPQAFGKLAKYMDVTDEALQNVQPILTFDTYPQYDSMNPVTSGGLYEYIELNSPTYINTFSNLQEMYSYSGDLTNNDYAFINSGSGVSGYKNVYQYKQGIVKHTIPNIRTTPTGTTVIENINDPALPSGNIMYELDCYVTAVNNQAYGQAPVMIVVLSDNTSDPIFVQNSSKTHIQKQYTKAIKLIQFTNSAQSSTGYTDFEDIKISTTNGWVTLSYKIYDPTFTATQISTINSGLTASDKTSYDNHIQNTQNPHSVTKAQVGLGNVDNTSDLDKPVSNAVQAELNKTVTDVSYNTSSKKLTKTINGVSSDVMVVDTVPSENSGNAVSSGGTYDFVNSSVATNTAYFIGTFSSIAELEAYTGTVTNNDYAFVTSTDSSGNTLYNRYKYNGSTQTWGFEYALNNTSFTTTQWATIQSGLTSADKTKLNGIETGANKTIVDSTMSSSSTNPVQNKVISDALDGKQNTLTFDQTPTNSSTNPVTSGGIYTDQQRQETEIGVVANAGAKNLLNPDDYIKNPTGGLTITETGTGTYKITGTPSGTVDVFTTQSGTFDRMYGLEAGKTYTISGLPTGNGLLCRIDVSKNNSGSWDAQIISNLTLPQTFTVPSDATGLYIRYRVTTSATIPSGGISLEPMIRPASITDSTFVPYAKTNRELTVAEDEDRAALVALVDGGAKNLVNAPSGSGIRFINIPIVLQPGDYYVLFQNIASTDTGAGVCQFGAFAEDNSQAVTNLPQLRRGDDIGAMFTVTKQTSYVRLYASSSYAGGEGDTVTFTGCMICTSADYAISPAFVPYRPSWQEMVDEIETKVSKEEVYGAALEIPANSDLNGYNVPGIYYAVAANVPTLVNTPYTSTGLRLVVEKNTLSGAAVFQTMYPTSISHLGFFRRIYEGGAWSNWYKFEGTEVTS